MTVSKTQEFYSVLFDLKELMCIYATNRKMFDDMPGARTGALFFFLDLSSMIRFD